MGAMNPNQESAKYVIDPRKYRTYRFYAGCMLIFWLIWTPLTLVVTYLACTQGNPFLFVWMIFGYVGVVGIPLVILSRNRKQILEVVGDSVIIKGTGILPTSKIRIYGRNLRSLTLEHYDDTFDRESVYTLNLLQKTGAHPERIMLAQFVHPRDKAIILEEIRTFLSNHGFHFNVRNEMVTETNDVKGAPAHTN